VGIPSAHALEWAMVAVDCSLARAARFFGIFLASCFFRFDGEFTLPTTCY
jgi:hypothetical protein